MRVLVNFDGSLNLLETYDINREGDHTFIELIDSDSCLVCDDIPLDVYENDLFSCCLYGSLDWHSFNFTLSYD